MVNSLLDKANKERGFKKEASGLEEPMKIDHPVERLKLGGDPMFQGKGIDDLYREKIIPFIIDF